MSNIYFIISFGGVGSYFNAPRVYLFLILFCTNCSKDISTTSVTGIVTNDATGLAMPNIATWIIAEDYAAGGQTYSDTSITDINGEYTLKVKGESIDVINMYVFKPGFAWYRSEIPAKADIERNIILSPLDSYITFKIINKLNESTGLYGAYWSNKLEAQTMSAIYYPIFIPYNSIYKETRKITGDNYINISWDNKFYPSDLFFPHLDSIYVPRGDTVTYNITM